MQTLNSIDPAGAAGKTKQIFDGLQKKLGVVPNLMRVLANSPAALNAYMSFSGALGEGKLSAKIREQLAIAVANANSCDYCLSAHNALGKLAGLAPDDLAQAQNAEATDPKTARALRFAVEVVRKRGLLPPSDVEALRRAGFSDGEVAEIIAGVALNIFTNYFNQIVGTEIDFPMVKTTAVSKAEDNEPKISYRNQKVGGVNIFYREAGSPSRPAVVLLHGFPSSSHMYRNLIPKLAGRYHVIAADMPGFGYSDQPAVDKFEYTFAHLTDVMDDFLSAIGVEKYSIYVMDYGAPVGFRLFVKHPERIQAIVTQNGNAYEEGLSPFWAEFLEPYWKERNAETEKKVRGLLALETTKFQYTKGTRNPENVNPDSYTFDQTILDRPGNPEIQLALFHDYQSNVKQYPQWHQTLRRVQPPVLCVWGKNDTIFSAPGAEAFRRDVPKAEIQFVDTGHFALEEDLDTIASEMLAFLAKNIR